MEEVYGEGVFFCGPETRLHFEADVAVLVVSEVFPIVRQIQFLFLVGGCRESGGFFLEDGEGELLSTGEGRRTCGEGQDAEAVGGKSGHAEGFMADENRQCNPRL